MPAPLHNQNAAKPAQEKANAVLFVRVRSQDKARWVRKAQRLGGLAKWVVATLNAAS